MFEHTVRKTLILITEGLMLRKFSLFALTMILVGGVAATVTSSAERRAGVDSSAKRGQTRQYDVTFTNVTRGQQFTPILVVTHRSDVGLFRAGEAASAELEALAETGNTAPLAALLQTMPGVGDINMSAGLLNPGESVTVTVDAGGPFRYISAASMLIPTNDAFLALNAVPLPGGARALGVSSPAYDAGTEINDELCASIPGPDFSECGGPGDGASPEGGEEGFVHIHAGIHGIGDMLAAERDWRNPVVRVSIRQVLDDDPEDGDDDDDDDD
jgi:hypothetical protein